MHAPAMQRDHLRRPVVLTFTATYLPGHKGGGPIRSVSHMLAALQDEFDFRIVTSDRDLGDLVPYPGIRADAWQTVQGASVLYLSPGPRRWWRVARLLQAADVDLIYLNSFFSRPFSMWPVWLRAIGLAARVPVLLAPRGEFSSGALGLKPSRKQLYIRAVARLGPYRKVLWHASAAQERADILRHAPGAKNLIVAPPLAAPAAAVPQPAATDAAPSRLKAAGRLRAVFAARICRMKNLDAALRILAGVRGDVEFNIYGPIEDAVHWEDCQQLIKALPPNVRVDYRGALNHAEVDRVLREHHVLLFPTRGENFGHVIIEALLAGCPVLLSDQTPWRQLREHGVGWDLPLDRPDLHRQALQDCVDMDEAAFQVMSRRAMDFAAGAARDCGPIAQNRQMLQMALARRPVDAKQGTDHV